MTSLLLHLVFTQLQPEIKVDLDQVYGISDGKALKYDFYHPRQTGIVPLVILIHGGAWTSGDKKEMSKIGTMFAAKGMAAASINYRLSPQNRWPAQLDDCQKSVQFFREHDKELSIDPKNIGACGASAGGHIAMLLGFREGSTGSKASSKVKVVLNLFGPCDLSQDFAPGLADSICKAVLGKPYKEAEPEIKEFSPISYLSGAVPVFTIQGTADFIVPPRQAGRLDEALTKLKVEHETRLIPGMGHEFKWKSPVFCQSLDEGIRFVKRHLQN